MTTEENIKAILTVCFTGFKEELIDIATYRIMELVDNAQTVTPCDNCIELECENHGVVCSHYTAIKDLKDKPQGKWILHKDYNERKYGCNQCGNLNNIPSDVCPNCKAKMDGGEEE